MTILEELINDSRNSKNGVEIFINQDPTDELLNLLGISEKSTLGNILKYTNGITIDNRFLRIFGGNDSEWTDSIGKWNNFPGQSQDDDLPSGCILIGHDVLGGLFAINGGYFGAELGKVFYFGPDTLKWENLNIGHTQFIGWCFAGDVGKFYESFRWANYQEMVDQTKSGQGITSYPFLWSQEGKDLNTTLKKVIPMRQIWRGNFETIRQLNASSVDQSLMCNLPLAVLVDKSTTLE